MDTIFNLREEDKSKGISAMPISDLPKLEFVNTSYKHANGSDGLVGINIKVEHNNRVAVAGGIGSGKNIIAQLMLRYFRPTDSKILFNGMELTQINKAFWRKNIIAFCSSNAQFVPGTIRYNMQLLNPDVTDEQILKTFKDIGADDFLQKFDNLLDYEITETYSLRDSAKNLLNLVRTILKPASIYIFNECFDHIKPEYLTKMMAKLKKEKRTCMFVTYNSAVCKGCNIVYVLKGGKVNGSGTHDELMKKNAEYKGFYASSGGIIQSELIQEEPRTTAEGMPLDTGETF
jgi:ABC-type multidrug transport system fused ATPase/permease subunit